MHLKINIYILLTTLIMSHTYGQDVNGKWLLKQMGVGKIKKTPVQHLLNIENENAILYMDVVPSENQLELKFQNNSLYLPNDKKYADFKIHDENNLSLLVEGNVNDKKGIIEIDFIRLFPTITDLTIDEIETFTYEGRENEKTKSKFEFNKEMMDLGTLKQLGHKEGQKMKIERMDSTLFLAIYIFGKKGALLPIKEVTPDFIKLYGIPNDTGEIIATRSE
jgi:hypothetical protein